MQMCPHFYTFTLYTLHFTLLCSDSRRLCLPVGRGGKKLPLPLVQIYKPLTLWILVPNLSLICLHKNVSAAANMKITRFIVHPITDKIQT